jgi:nucleoid DNA-binding protein
MVAYETNSMMDEEGIDEYVQEYVEDPRGYDFEQRRYIHKSPSNVPQVVSDKDFIKNVALLCGLTSKKTLEVFNIAASCIVDNLRQGRAVGVPKFGIFHRSRCRSMDRYVETGDVVIANSLKMEKYMRDKITVDKSMVPDNALFDKKRLKKR